MTVIVLEIKFPLTATTNIRKQNDELSNCINLVNNH